MQKTALAEPDFDFVLALAGSREQRALLRLAVEHKRFDRGSVSLDDDLKRGIAILEIRERELLELPRHHRREPQAALLEVDAEQPVIDHRKKARSAPQLPRGAVWL